MKKICFKVMAIIFAVVAFALPLTFVPASAQTTTNYDDVVSVTDSLVLYNRETRTGTRLDQNWYGMTKDALQNTHEMYPSHVPTATYFNLLEGDWFVVSDRYHGSTYLSVYYTGQAPGSASASFTEDCDGRASPCLKLSAGVQLYVAHFSFDYYGYIYGSTRPIEDEALESYAIIAQDNHRATGSYDVVVSTFDVSYPVGYQGEAIPSTFTPRTPTYVAMSDSFSSGEGNPPFTSRTTIDGVNECHRSAQAYPYLMSNNPTLDLGPVDFVACSGAKTSHVLYGGSGNGNRSEGAQINALSEDTKIVTISIGGNDVGFRDYAVNCVLQGCGAEGAAFYDIVNRIADPAFEARLKLTFETILERAPNARIYVFNYPYITTDGQAWCGILNVATARPVQELLNHVIWGAVWSIGQVNSRIHYVDTNKSGSSFAGRHLCGDGDEYFNGINLLNREYSLHPNILGHRAYHNLLEGELE